MKESVCVIHPGRLVGVPLRSAHLGTCDKDFPDHHTKLCDANNDNVFQEWGICLKENAKPARLPSIMLHWLVSKMTREEFKAVEGTNTPVNDSNIESFFCSNARKTLMFPSLWALMRTSLMLGACSCAGSTPCHQKHLLSVKTHAKANSSCQC